MSRVLVCAAAAVLLWTSPHAMHAATVRGQVTCSAGNPSAVTGYYATVFRGDIGRSKRAEVDSDGKFYLYNVPTGKFALEIWLRSSPGAPPKVFEIAVRDPYTDVPSLSISC